MWKISKQKNSSKTNAVKTAVHGNDFRKCFIHCDGFFYIKEQMCKNCNTCLLLWYQKCIAVNNVLKV